MDGFRDRERAAEAKFAHDRDEEYFARMARVKTLGTWASHAMDATPDDAARYQDILDRIAISTPDDRILTERVRDDLAAAGVYMTVERVGAILAKGAAEAAP